MKECKNQDIVRQSLGQVSDHVNVPFTSSVVPSGRTKKSNIKLSMAKRQQLPQDISLWIKESYRNLPCYVSWGWSVTSSGSFQSLPLPIHVSRVPKTQKEKRPMKYDWWEVEARGLWIKANLNCIGSWRLSRLTWNLVLKNKQTMKTKKEKQLGRASLCTSFWRSAHKEPFSDYCSSLHPLLGVRSEALELSVGSIKKLLGWPPTLRHTDV